MTKIIQIFLIFKVTILGERFLVSAFFDNISFWDTLFSKMMPKIYSHWPMSQKYTYRVLQTIQMKLILLCVWAERVVLGSAKTALKFNYEI